MTGNQVGASDRHARNGHSRIRDQTRVGQAGREALRGKRRGMGGFLREYRQRMRLPTGAIQKSFVPNTEVLHGGNGQSLEVAPTGTEVTVYDHGHKLYSFTTIGDERMQVVTGDEPALTGMLPSRTDQCTLRTTAIMVAQ